MWFGKQQSPHAVCHAACWWYYWWSSSDAAATVTGRDFIVFSVPRSGSWAHLQPHFQWRASVFSLSWEPGHVFNRVGFRLRFPGTCLSDISSQSLLAVNVAEHNFLMGWDLGWRMDRKGWKSCQDAVSAHIHLLWNRREKYRRQNIKHQILSRSRGLAILVGTGIPSRVVSSG